ncbi:MAG TPA: ABC transporter permease [Opitutaceae bacterium]|jgi:putative ABC transport system permease protein|nr:ABC transporter permease [Opitutaceae bacterium]
MLPDLKYAFRQLYKSPGFALIAILTLALGMGASTAIFSVVNSVLLRPLPYPDSEHLVALNESQPPKSVRLPVSPANFQDWSNQSKDVFEDIYAETRTGLNLTDQGDPVRIQAGLVTHEMFNTLRIQPMLGRAFGAEEETAGKGNVVVLLYGFWLRQFGSRPDVIGKTIRLSGQPYTIIGVMPLSFKQGSPQAILMPLVLTDQQRTRRGNHFLDVFGRLKTGVTLEQARARMNVIAAQLARQYPDTNKGFGVTVLSLLGARTQNSRQMLLTLLGAVTVLLLIAWTNVANLLLARATTREREICIRMAIGASRWRIARQLLIECLVLVCGGAFLGLLVAKGGLALLLAYAPEALPRPNFEIVVDGRAVAVTFALALLTGLGFGLVSALQGSRVDLNGVLKTGGRGASGGRHLVRYGLIVAEIALALMLLTGAGLLIRSFARLATFNPGFNPHGIIVVRAMVSGEKYNTPEKQFAFVEAVLSRYQKLSGVTDAAAAQALPIFGGYNIHLKIAGREMPASDLPVIDYYSVSPDYFRTSEIRLFSGRVFTNEDRAGATPVALISQAAAKQFFPDTDPIGKLISPVSDPSSAPKWREIVGVVADVVSGVNPNDLQSDAPPQIYTPFAQTPYPAFAFIVRANGGAAAFAGILRHAIYNVDPEQPVATLDTYDNLLMGQFSSQKFAMFLFITFSVIALILAAIGIYGVVAFSVSQRTNEFGVRMALGARPGDVFRLVISQGGRIAGYGIAFGVVGALAAERFIKSMLFQTPAYDPLVFGAISLLLVAVALVACLLPARRATKVDPIVALRVE